MFVDDPFLEHVVHEAKVLLRVSWHLTPIHQRQLTTSICCDGAMCDCDAISCATHIVICSRISQDSPLTYRLHISEDVAKVNSIFRG
jgi:hypothetical protein